MAGLLPYFMAASWASFGLAAGSESHMGGCQNYGPFLGPYYDTAPII